MDDAPEVLLTIQEAAEVRAYIANQQPQPVDMKQLAARLKAFATTFHFAFGDANNRDVAIGMWVRALSPFPEWAVKAALDEITATYDGAKPLVPGMAVAKAQTLSQGLESKADKYEAGLQYAVLFNDERSKEQYIADKIAAKKQNQEAMAAFRERLKQMDTHIYDEAAEKARISEEKEKLRQKRQEQLARMKAASETLKDHKRLQELLQEAEAILVRQES